jgi:hypothetical protein
VVRGGERSDGAEANVGRGEGALATPGGPMRSERRRANDDLLDTRESIDGYEKRNGFFVTLELPSRTRPTLAS